MNKITLYQPRHNLAQEEEKGQIYLPSSLSTAAARILVAGGDVEIQDGNLRKPDFTKSNIVGATLLGPPYIPGIIELKKRIIEVVGEEAKLVLGGQVLGGKTSDGKTSPGLTAEQFNRLFGPNTFNGNDDWVLKKLLGLELRAMPAAEETSHVPAYEKISDENFKEYLTHEFSFYLSQGCKYGCKFCAANRTFTDPVSGETTTVKEKYRNLSVVEDELKYMVARAQKLGINSFEIYLSNLDTFQTPDKLKEFAEIVLGIKRANPGFVFKMRGLSTAKAFMDTYRKDKEVITKMVDAGLWSIGFGVDGTSPEIWQSEKKGHNRIKTCIDAIRLTREEFNITPEVLMVIGHQKDTPKTMLDAVHFSLEMVERYGAVPRPYVAKDMLPSNSRWGMKKNKARVKAFIQHPEYFEALDYSALPSSLTHPNADMRPHIEHAFLMMTNIPGNTTNPLYPISPDIDARTAEIHRRLNQGKFDR